MKREHSGRKKNAATGKVTSKAIGPRTSKGAVPRKRFVPPQDERGVPYPGDWPNPLEGKVRGCY